MTQFQITENICNTKSCQMASCFVMEDTQKCSKEEGAGEFAERSMKEEDAFPMLKTVEIDT